MGIIDQSNNLAWRPSSTGYSNKPTNYTTNIGAANLDIKALSVVANNDTIGANNSPDNVKVFAGFVANNTTYNRSFWYVPGDLMSKDNQTLTVKYNATYTKYVGNYAYTNPVVNSVSFENHPYKYAVYFYPTQHWAGPIYGGYSY